MASLRFTASIIARYAGRTYAAVDCGRSSTHYMTCSASTDGEALRRAKAEARRLNRAAEDRRKTADRQVQP